MKRPWYSLVNMKCHLVQDCGFGIYELIDSFSHKIHALNWVQSAVRNRVIKPTAKLYVIESLGKGKWTTGKVVVTDRAVTTRQLSLSM